MNVGERATRWFPETYRDVVEALEDGRIEEGAHLEFKRELATGSAANLKLARSLASFANDGGTLVFGVDEPAAGVYRPSPVPANGLRERIEQVAASRVDPPLFVQVQTIRTESDPGEGIVVVRVPASAAAPHMVDGRYYGRAGSTTTMLSDAQVRAVINNREAAMGPVLELLNEDIGRDPIPPDLRRHAHLHVVARPRFAPDDLVLSSVMERADGNWSTWFHKHLLAGPFRPRFGSAWSPDLTTAASSVGHRAVGAALHDHYIGQDRSASELVTDPDKLGRYEDGLLDLEVEEDGTLHLYCGRASDTHPSSGEVVLPVVVAGLVLRTVQIAARITELAGWVGTWEFAAAVTDLRGLTPHTKDWRDPSPAYSADDYRNATSAVTAELSATSHDCTDRLVGRMLRGLGQAGGVGALFPLDSGANNPV